MSNFDRLKPEHRPPVRAVEKGVPIYNFGYASVYGAPPDLVDEHAMQVGAKANAVKQKLKKSWEIENNYLGVCTTRMPRLPEHDEQTLEICHLLDGDDTTCWGSYPHSRPDDRPVWIKIDLAKCVNISRIIIRKRRITFDRSQFRGSYLTGGRLIENDPRVQEIGRAVPKKLTIRTSIDTACWQEHFSGEVNRENAESFEFDICAYAKHVYIEGTQLDLCENWCYMFSIASVEVYDSTGKNIALLSRGASAIASSTHHLGQCELECSDWYWPMHFDLGVKWSRIGYHDDMINWHWVEREKGVLAVDSKADNAVTELFDNGVKIIFNICFGNRLYEGYPERRFPQLNEWYYETPFPPRSEEALKAWDRFVCYCIDHFKDRVEYFEVWNEWNGEGYWGDAPDPEHYIRLAKRTIALLREKCPEKKIMMGSYAGFPHGERPDNCTDYIAPFYRAVDELAPLVDAIGFHPFYNPSVNSENWNEYPQNFEAFRDYCIEKGFKGGVFMASEYSVTAWEPGFLPNTPGVWWGGQGTYNYTDIEKAKVIADFCVMNTAMGIYSQYCELSQTNYPLDNSLLYTGWETYPSQASAPSPSYYVTRNLCSELENVTPDDGKDYFTHNGKELFVFKMKRGDTKLLTFWKRNTVSTECSGNPVNFELSFEAKKIVAYNCMNGEYTPIDFVAENGKTVILGLLARDYPSIIEIR